MSDDIYPAQLRAARALAGWKRDQLAQAAGTTERTIARIEDGQSVPRASTAQAIRAALESAGVEFIPAGQYQGDGGPGVRLRKAD
jgi:Predicted transcriptional regulator with C-terminal CBS domains